MDHDKLDELFRILNHSHVGSAVDVMNSNSRQYKCYVHDMTFTDLVFKFVRETHICNSQTAQTKAIVLRSELKLIMNMLLLSPKVKRADKCQVEKLMKMLAEWLDYGFMHALFLSSDEIIVRTIPIKKRKAGRPPYIDSENGFPFEQLVKDACLLWDVVSNFWDSLMTRLKEHNYQITPENYKQIKNGLGNTQASGDDKESDSDVCRLVRGYTILFHLFTHRFLDKDSEGNFIYDAPPIYCVSGSVLNFEHEGIDPRFLTTDEKHAQKFVWNVNCECTFSGTETLRKILENAQNDKSMLKNIQTDDNLFSPDRNNVGSLFLFVREILIMNKEKRWWHLKKMINYIRQQRSRAQQKRSQIENAGAGASFFQRFAWIRSLPDIQKLHPGAKEPIKEGSVEKISNVLAEQMRRHDQKNKEKELFHSEKTPLEKVPTRKKKKENSTPDNYEPKQKRMKSLALKGMLANIYEEFVITPRMRKSESTESFSIDEQSLGGTYWIEVFGHAKSVFESEERKELMSILRLFDEVWTEEIFNSHDKFLENDLSEIYKIRDKLARNIFEMQEEVDKIIRDGEEQFYMTEIEYNKKLKEIKEMKDVWRDFAIVNSVITN